MTKAELFKELEPYPDSIEIKILTEGLYEYEPIQIEKQEEDGEEFIAVY